MCRITEKMTYMHNILIPYPEPEVRSHSWLYCLIGLLLVCLLFIPHRRPEVSYDYEKDPNITSWLSKDKASQIMRYHGANAIKITEDQVYILRDGRWISVYREPSLPPEQHVHRDIITMADQNTQDKI